MKCFSIIISASHVVVRHGTSKYCIWCFKMETFLGYLHFTFVTENSCNAVFFLNHHLKSVFSNTGGLKHQHNLVYELYEYSTQK